MASTARPARAPARRTRPPLARTAGRTAAYGVALLYGLVSVYPFLWMLSGAFKNQREVLGGASLIPAHPTLDTVRTTWDSLDFGTYLANSVKVTGLSILLILLLYPLAAYAFAVLRFPGRRALYGVFLAALLVPSVTVLLPIILLDDQLGVLGTHWGIIWPMVNGAGPLAVLLLHSYFGSVPTELRDAARMDGASEWRVYWRIYFPLARPALVTVAVLNFVSTWNEYVLPSVALNDPGLYTLPRGLQNLVSTTVVHWNEVMAGAVFLVAPLIVVFVFLQRFFIEALAGSVKG